MTKFLKWTIYISMALVPFLAFYVTSIHPDNMQMLFPYITGKNFAFRILVEIAAAAWLMLMIINPQYRPKKSLLLYAYSIFIFILLIADIFSVNSTKSFFSNFERMEGFITHAHLFLYFLILISVYKTREHFENYKFVLLLSNIPVLILAWLQLLGTQNIFTHFIPTLRDTIHKHFFPSQGGIQLDSSLGNSTYLAIYVVFFIFLFFMLFVENKIKNKSYTFPLVMTILNLIVLYYTGTRGAQLGLVISILVVSFILFFAGRKFEELRKIRKYALGAVIFIIASFILLISISNTDFVKNNDRLERIANVASLLNPINITDKIGEAIIKIKNPNTTYTELLETFNGHGTAVSRFLNIKMSLEGWTESIKTILIGWGQDNYSYVFAKYNDPRMYSQEPWFDRSHNVFMDWLIAAGILGLLAYLSLYFIAIYTMWFSPTTRKHHDSYIDFLEKSLLTGLLIAYFIHNIFVFDNLISYILFFFILAYIGIRFDYIEKVEEKDFDAKSNYVKNMDDRVLIYGPLILIVLFSIIYFLNIRYIKANLAIVNGLNSQRHNTDISPLDPINRSLNSFKQAIDIGGIATMESREQLTQQTINLIKEIRQIDISQNKDINSLAPIYKILSDFIETTNNEYKKLINSQKNPDPRSLSIYGTYLLNIDSNEEAIKYLKSVYEFAPKKQSIAIAYIQALIQNKNYTEALNVAEKMYKNDISYDQAKNIYAMILAYNKKYNDAISVAPNMKDNIELIKKEIEIKK